MRLKALFLAICVSITILNVNGALHQPKREFRGGWIQCVNGQFIGQSRDQMQQNLTRQINALQRCHVNAVFFQVRAEADALYPSELEPWSRFISGKQGVAPSPYWDPLQWMIDECHARGMELHAWINPYRAKTANTTTLAANHPYMQHPERFFEYGKLLLFDPAQEVNRKYICKVVSDILTRYDVDGIHMDDYFYPYPEQGQLIPDQEGYRQMGAGFSTIQDWRRDNVSRLIKALHETIRQLKPWVKFGVSPFGIYHNLRNGNEVPGSNTGGLQNYDDLYADVLQWTTHGWVDYNIPQIYWEIGHPTADYDTLIRWWAKYTGSRPLFIGQDVERTVKAADLNNPQINQLPEKMRLQRSIKGVSGNCLWYAAAVANNTGNILTALEQTYQPYYALQPRMAFLDKDAPHKIRGAKVITDQGQRILVWLSKPTKDEMQKAVRYAVYKFNKGEKINLDDPSHIITITPQNYLMLPPESKDKATYVVTALDRLWNESKPRKVKVK